MRFTPRALHSFPFFSACTKERQACQGPLISPGDILSTVACDVILSCLQ
jgi:hypothetical protein